MQEIGILDKGIVGNNILKGSSVQYAGNRYTYILDNGIGRNDIQKV